MANFLFFVLVFACQLIAGLSIPKLPPPVYGSKLSILSVDGGGIKGIIPAKVLDHLDQALKAKDPNVPLAYYFDVIGGTSTGGLIAAMLTSPSSDDPNRPLFTPAEIVKFYKDNGPSIFNKSSHIVGPEFDGEFLHNITRELLKETRLSDTFTNVLIPTFDIKTQKPVIFSNYKLNTVPYLNAKMSDICIGTSAAPSYLPPIQFENEGFEFNLIDGGVAAGNPTQATVSEAIRHNEFTELHVLSLGTGVTKVVEKYNAIDASDWGKLHWILFALPEFLPRASTDMTEFYLATLPANSYLRIEEYDLNPSMADMANVTQENLDNLEAEGTTLLNERVVRMNPDTFEIEETGEGTNAEALDRLADILYNERQLRLKRKSMEKGRRPFMFPFNIIQATQAITKNILE